MEKSQREKNLIAGRREEHGPCVLYWEPTFIYREGGNQIIRKCFTIDDTSTYRRYRYDDFEEATKALEFLSRPHAVKVAMQAMGLLDAFEKAEKARDNR